MGFTLIECNKFHQKKYPARKAMLIKKIEHLKFLLQTCQADLDEIKAEYYG
jgi:hypothetical protein